MMNRFLRLRGRKPLCYQGWQHSTFDKGRAWMPEVERPEFRKDAKPTERSYGKCGSAFLGIALLGFAIRINVPVNIDEGKNQSN